MCQGEDLRFSIGDEDWEKMFEILERWTIGSKYQERNCKIVMRRYRSPVI